MTSTPTPRTKVAICHWNGTMILRFQGSGGFSGVPFERTSVIASWVQTPIPVDSNRQIQEEASDTFCPTVMGVSIVVSAVFRLTVAAQNATTAVDRVIRSLDVSLDDAKLFSRESI